jgi:hypothetical protein
MAWQNPAENAPNFDTGTGVDVPLVLTELTPSLVWVIGMDVTNTAAVEILLTFTDHAGNFVNEFFVAAGASPEPREWPFRPLTGLKWVASAAGLKAHVWGYQ